MPPPPRPQRPPQPGPGGPPKSQPAEAVRQGIRSPSTEIEGVTYTITTIDADRGLVVSPVLLDYVTGPLASAVMAFAGVEQSAPVLLQALNDLTRKLREPDFRALVWELLRGARVNGREIPDPHIHFAAHYGVLVRVALFAIKENFGSFLDMFPPEQRAKIAGTVGHLISQAENILSQRSSSSEDGPPPPISEPDSTSPTS